MWVLSQICQEMKLFVDLSLNYATLHVHIPYCESYFQSLRGNECCLMSLHMTVETGNANVTRIT